MENDPRHGDYFEANRFLFESLIRLSDRFLASNPASIIEIKNDKVTYLGRPDNPLPYDDMSPEFITQANEILKRTEIEVAQIEKITLRTLVNMHHAAISYQPSDRDEQPLLNAQSYEWAEAKVGTEQYDLSVMRTKAINLDHYGQAVGVLIRISDGLIIKSLSIASIGDVIMFTSIHIRPEEDEVLRRCITVFAEEEHTELTTRYMTGVYDSVEELENYLQSLRAKYQTTSKEDEVMPLLDEILNRARAAKESRELNFAFNTDQPTVEQLQDFENILNDNLI